MGGTILWRWAGGGSGGQARRVGDGVPAATRIQRPAWSHLLAPHSPDASLPHLLFSGLLFLAPPWMRVSFQAWRATYVPSAAWQTRVGGKERPCTTTRTRPSRLHHCVNARCLDLVCARVKPNQAAGSVSVEGRSVLPFRSHIALVNAPRGAVACVLTLVDACQSRPGIRRRFYSAVG